MSIYIYPRVLGQIPSKIPRARPFRSYVRFTQEAKRPVKPKPAQLDLGQTHVEKRLQKIDENGKRW
jgi:hypothetical protein